MKKFISILIISILFSAYANAGILKGYVVDPDGNPLAGAFVHDKSAKTTAVADSDGYFEIELDLQKEKSVVVEFMGFATNVFSFERPGDIQIIVMQPNAQIEETVVTSHGRGSSSAKGMCSILRLSHRNPLPGPPAATFLKASRPIRPWTSPTAMR
jgi:hypothetical protein